VSGATIAVLILGTLLFGVLLCAVAVFFYFLLKNVKLLASSVHDLREVAQTIADDQTLKTLGPSLHSITQYAPMLMRSNGNLVEVIKVWNELVLDANNQLKQTRGRKRSALAETEASGVYQGTEADFARAEKVQRLRQQGVEVDEMEEQAPAPAQVVRIEAEEGRVVVAPEDPPPPGS